MPLKNLKNKLVWPLFLTVLGIPLDANNANACWKGVFENIEIGDSITSLFDSNQKVGYCGGEFTGTRHIGKEGIGYVFCSYRDERMNDKGRRVLVINGSVVAIKEGGGNIHKCSWDNASP